ncbi:MAG: hypothetical protein J4F29_14785 [Candidatus Latescibacteria bacterium]|nr:hypothetical protein [Candidatus Latescibacterota bacterium]
MNQLTISGFDEELTDKIQHVANQEGISLNQAALKLMRFGAGLGQTKNASDTVGTSLDHLIGTWTREEADELNNALKDFDQIDEYMWK